MRDDYQKRKAVLECSRCRGNEFYHHYNAAEVVNQYGDRISDAESDGDFWYECTKCGRTVRWIEA